jgi:L-rhamnose mutarotase
MNPNSAFKMKLKSGCAAEYKKRHNKIWPEVVALLKQRGIFDYSLFLDQDEQTIFVVRKINIVASNKFDPLSNPIMQKWWDYMADIMETNPDNSPAVSPLNSIFHLP